MYCNRRHLLLCLFFIAIGSCQPLPQPFHPTLEKKVANPTLKLPKSGDVSVIRILGIEKDLAERLSLEIVHALRKQNFLSTSGVGNKRSITLEGRVTVFDGTNQDIKVQIVWELFNSQGFSLGQQKSNLQVDKFGWANRKNKTIQKLATHAANNVILMLKPPTPITKTIKKEARSVYLWPIYGAPSDAAAFLREQLIFYLKQKSIRIISKLQEKTLVLMGEVSLLASRTDKKTLVIRWTLFRPDGGEIGNLYQEKEVPNHVLELDWPDIAKTIANTAAQGIVELLSKTLDRQIY